MRFLLFSPRSCLSELHIIQQKTINIITITEATEQKKTNFLSKKKKKLRPRIQQHLEAIEQSSSCTIIASSRLYLIGKHFNQVAIA
jgi:2-phospho-L-lactate guanylyltransferase (CobY/MobA/RfbA family)